MSRYEGPLIYHQLGYQDQKRALEMLKVGHGDGVILSPRDLQRTNWREDLLNDYAEQFSSTNTVLLVDPQGYDPGKVLETDSSVVRETNGLLDPNIYTPFVETGLAMQYELGATQFIIPGTFTESIDENWLGLLVRAIQIAKAWAASLDEPITLLATVAVHMSEVSSEEQRRRLLTTLATQKIDGFYIVIAEVDSSINDQGFLFGLLELIFRLRWQGKMVVLGYSGPWAMLAFPFGLNAFANSGLKNRQSFKQRDWRGEKPPGGGRKKFLDFWSPDLLSYLRFPGDAEFLRANNQWQRYQRQSPYEPSFDTSPAEIYESKQWSMGRSLQHFTWEMWQLASEFRPLNRQGRINLVRRKLNTAEEMCKISQRALPSNPGVHLTAWRNAFEEYLEEAQDDLADEFD